jgi:hypothetical protein
MTSCPNCSQKLQNRFEFCPFCGEAVNRHRFTLKHIAAHFIESFTHLDFKVLKYVKLIFTKPWFIVYEFLHGRQKKFFSPYIAFVIAAGILSFVMYKTVKIHQNYVMTNLVAKQSSYKKEVYDSAIIYLEKNFVTTDKLLSINKYFHVVNLFMYALPFWLVICFFRKKAYNYIETVFAFMIFWTPVMCLYAVVEIINTIYSFNPQIVLLSDQVVSISISIFISIFFYKLLGTKNIMWLLFFAALFYLLDNFVASYLIQFVYSLLKLL